MDIAPRPMTEAPATSLRAPPPTAVCSTCRAAIAPDRTRYRCSVTACNAGRQKLLFCSVGCFEEHIPTARHRRATCVEERSSKQVQAGADGDCVDRSHCARICADEPDR